MIDCRYERQFQCLGLFFSENMFSQTALSLHEYAALQGHIPFAVVGSMEEIKVGNKMVKARQYPWGTVQGNSYQTVIYFCVSFDSCKSLP